MCSRTYGDKFGQTLHDSQDYAQQVIVHTLLLITHRSFVLEGTLSFARFAKGRAVLLVFWLLTVQLSTPEARHRFVELKMFGLESTTAGGPRCGASLLSRSELSGANYRYRPNFFRISNASMRPR